jgi:hypothetical protein
MEQLVSDESFISHFLPQVHDERILFRSLLLSYFVLVFECFVRKESSLFSYPFACLSEFRRVLKRRQLSKPDAQSHSEGDRVKIISQSISIFLWHATVGFSKEELCSGAESKLVEEGHQVYDLTTRCCLGQS